MKYGVNEKKKKGHRCRIKDSLAIAPYIFMLHQSLCRYRYAYTYCQSESILSLHKP